MIYLPVTLEDQQILAQGLVRHAVKVTNALAQETDLQLTVVTPKWARKMVSSAVKESESQQMQSIQVVSPASRSLSEVITWILLRRGGRRRLSAQRSELRRPPLRIAATLRSDAPSWTRAIGLSILLTSAIAILGWFILQTKPIFLVVLAIAAMIVLALGLLAERLAAKSFTARAASTLTSSESPRVDRLTKMRQFVALTLEKADVGSLVRFANRTGIREWWVPIGLYSGAAKLKGSIVTTFADFSPAEFPYMLTGGQFAVRGSEMAELLRNSNAIVALSQHVVDRHLPTLVPDFAGKTFVISPGPPSRQTESQGAEGSSDAWSELINMLNDRFPDSRAAVKDWWKSPVICVPSQERPYKNLRGLADAVGILNREMHIPVRLVLTAQEQVLGLGRDLDAAGNRHFVEFLPNIDDAILSRVLQVATLAASPSLFEGSLPFTLFEGVSNGTPCLLADIPVTRAALAIRPDVLDRTLFNPNSPRNMAEVIRRSLTDPEQLLHMQEEFVQAYYAVNSWDRVAHRYLAVFNDVSPYGLKP